jgi:oligosaccharide repeat unit polymerase
MPEFSLLNYVVPLLFLALSFLMSLGSKLKNAPASVLIGMWIVLLSVHGLTTGLEITSIYPTSLVANMLMTACVLALAWSLMLWQKLLVGGRKSPGKRQNVNFSRDTIYSMSRFSLWLITVYSAVIFYFVYQTASEIVGAVNVLSSLQLLRSQLNYGGAGWGGLDYAGLTVAIFSAYTLVITKGSKPYERFPAYLIFILAIGITIISTQRTTMFMLLIAIAFGSSASVLPKGRHLLILAGSLLGVFFLMGFFVGKIGSETLTLGQTLQSGLDAFLIYFLTPMSAFDASRIWEVTQSDFGFFSRFFQRIYGLTGADVGEVKSIVMKFIYVPMATNVYTFAFVSISDFGLFFPFYFCLVGLLLAVSFSLPRRIPAVKVMQGLCFYPIIMTLYQDQFFTLTSTWLQIIITLLVCHMLTKRRYNIGNRSAIGQVERSETRVVWQVVPELQGEERLT